MDRVDIIKKNRNEWFDKAVKYKAEIKELQTEIEDLKDVIAKGFNEAAETLLIELRDELKAKDLTIELIKNHAAIGFDNNLLALITEIEKDPTGFEQVLKEKT